MPVYDIAAGQVMAKPVSSMMEGKAVRLALESEKLKNQAMEQDIEAAPDIRARDQQQADADLLKAQTEYAKSLREMDEAQREEQVRELTGAYSVYKDTMAATEDPEQAAQAAGAYMVSQGGTEEDIAGLQEAARSVGGLDRFLRAMISEAGGDTAETRTFDALTEGFSEEERAEAARIKAGLFPRAVGDSNITITRDESIAAEDVARTAGTVKGGERAGAQAIEQSGKAMDQLGQVRQSMRSIDDAITALDEGANTGAIASRLPSVQSASIALENVQSQMGLNIIGATTFGSLSEEELKFALRTALPTGLSESELKKWLQRKKKAQEKLAQELEGAAIYLGTPGNTVAGYMQFMRDQGALSFEEQERDEPSPAGLSDDELKKALEL